jgi:adenylate cyclase
MVVKVRRVCVPNVALEGRVAARTQHDAETVARHLRVLTVTTRIGAVVSLVFGFQGLIVGQDLAWIAMVNLVSGATFLMIPLLYRFGEVIPALVFFAVAYTSITVLCWHVGTGSGLPFYYLVAATLMVLILGVDHLVLASVLAAILAATVIALEVTVAPEMRWRPNTSGRKLC